MKNCLFILLLFPIFLNAQLNQQLDSINRLEGANIQSNSHKIIPFLLHFIQEAHTDKNKLLEAKANSMLSLTCYYAGEYDDNKKYSLRAIQLYQELNEKELLSKEYGELGYRMKDIDLKKAEEIMLKGLLLAEKDNFTESLPSIYNNYGVIKLRLEQQDSALFYFKKGITLRSLLKDSIGLSYGYNNMGSLYLDLSEFQLAEYYFVKAMKIRQNSDNQYGISENYAFFGDLYLKQKDYQKAINNFLKSLLIAQKNSITNLIQYDYSMLTTCYDSLGDFKNALLYANKRQSLGDSLLNAETNAKIVEYQTQYETAEKEKELLQQQIIAKKKQNTIIVLMIVLTAVFIISSLIYRALKLRNKQQQQEFELKNAIAVIETKNQLQEQRLSISRDLHDNIGAQLTFIISSVDTLKYAFKITDDKITAKLNSISSFTKDTITELRDTIWAMNHAVIDFEEIHGRINNFVKKANMAIDAIQIKFEVGEGLDKIEFTSVEGMNIYRIIQEALNNALKYAQASVIGIYVILKNDEIQITIQDNGIGFDSDSVEKGNGLGNMRKRATEINASLTYISTENGTTVSMKIKK